MKIKITPQEIIFNYFFFAVIIPKNTRISYVFPMEFTDILGESPKMILIPENKKINYRFYFISKFVYWFLEIIDNYLWRYTSAAPPIILLDNRYTTIENSINHIFFGFLRKKEGFDYIQKIIKSLKENGYNVVEAENKLIKILELEKKQLNPIEQKIVTKNSLLFFLIVCLLSSIPLIFIYLQDYWQKNMQAAALISALSGVFFIFGTSIAFFAKKRDFLIKFLIIVIIIIMLANFLDELIRILL